MNKAQYHYNNIITQKYDSNSKPHNLNSLAFLSLVGQSILKTLQSLKSDVFHAGITSWATILKKVDNNKAKY